MISRIRIPIQYVARVLELLDAHLLEVENRRPDVDVFHLALKNEFTIASRYYGTEGAVFLPFDRRKLILWMNILPQDLRSTLLVDVEQVDER